MIGFVAFLDILGFKQAVLRDTFDGLSAAYVAIVSDAILGTGCKYALASDSIIVTTEGYQPERLLALANVSAHISYRTLTEVGFPIRGGITHGSFGRQTSKDGGGVLVAGPAVVSAYLLEQSQDWIGVMIAPSVIKLVPDVRLRANGADAAYHSGELQKNMQWSMTMRRHSVPMRDSLRLDAWAVVPHKTAELADVEDALGLKTDLERYRTRLMELRLNAGDHRSQRKYQSAASFVALAIDDAERARVRLNG